MCNLQVQLLFLDSKTMATLANYTCKSFIKLTLGVAGKKGSWSFMIGCLTVGGKKPLLITTINVIGAFFVLLQASMDTV